uniref:Uncharacterized protein n=1 Tax=Arundo donax TaxID=35708 RepID=A0A0A9F7L1_ARUDO
MSCIDLNNRSIGTLGLQIYNLRNYVVRFR